MHIHYRMIFWALLISQGILINVDSQISYRVGEANKKGYGVDNMVISPASTLSDLQCETAILPGWDWVPPPGTCSDDHGNIRVFPPPFHTYRCIMFQPISNSNSLGIASGVWPVSAKLRLSTNNSQQGCASILIANFNANDKMQNLKILQLFCTLTLASPRINLLRGARLMKPDLWSSHIRGQLKPLRFSGTWAIKPLYWWIKLVCTGFCVSHNNLCFALQFTAIVQI